MLLVFTKPFGNYKPGDEIELPDGALYDRQYLTPVPPAPPTKEKGDKE